jgi:hypothetical protein
MEVAPFAAAPRGYLKNKVAPAAEHGLRFIGNSKLRGALLSATTTDASNASDASNADASNASDTSMPPRR